MKRRQKKETAKEIREIDIDHERLNSLINSMADAVIALDENIRIVRYNAAALNILDLNNLRLSTPLKNVFQPINSENQLIDVDELVLSAKVPQANRDLRLVYSDSSIINLYISIAPVRLSYGADGQSGYVLLLRDITREKSLEEERDEFISVTSHELRTPIAIAEGNISNAMFLVDKDNSIDVAIKSALSSAHDQVLFLADLINDLSTLSRADRNALELEITTIDVKELMSELEKLYKKQVEDKGIKLVCRIDDDVTTLNSGRLYVREVLQNFITNAIKYTEQGQITVTASKSQKGIKFAVKDSGLGISKADQERVFDKFFRSEDYRTRKANGTGLGLYVTFKLTKLLHGRIELDSELNKGSTFSIYVPSIETEHA